MTKRMILLVAVLALVAAACGGSGDGDSSGVASLSTVDTGSNGSAAGIDAGAEIDPEEAMLELTQCIRDQGIDIDDPTVDAEGNPQLARPEFEDGPPAGFREAIQTCAESLEGVTLGRGGQDLSEIQDTFVEFAACMRENGYQMDDPDFSASGEPGEGDGPGQGGPIRIFEFDENDPEFEAAFEVCEEILAGFGPGRGGGRPGGA